MSGMVRPVLRVSLLEEAIASPHPAEPVHGYIAHKKLQGYLAHKKVQGYLPDEKSPTSRTHSRPMPEALLEKRRGALAAPTQERLVD